MTSDREAAVTADRWCVAYEIAAATEPLAALTKLGDGTIVLTAAPSRGRR